MTDLAVNIDVKSALAALAKLAKGFDNTAKKADDSFGQARDELGRFVATGESGGKKIKKGFGGVNSALGGLTTGLGGLVAGFAAVSAAGVAAFAAIAAEGVQLASEFENAQITFANIFGGDTGASEAFLGRLQQQSLELGTSFNDLTGLAKALLPDTESLDQFDRLTKAAVTLEKSDPDKTLEDVRIAIEGALSGDFTSLQQRFDLPDATIDNIKNLQGELGAVEGIVAGLEAEFQRTGQSLEGFTDTFASTQDRITARFGVLQTQLGQPIMEALTEEFSFFDELLTENADTLTLVAQQLGDVAAAVVEFVGTGINDFLADLDFTKFQELATAFFELMERGRLLVDLLFQMDDATPNDSIDFLIGLIDKLNRAFETASQVVALVKAEMKAIVGDLKNLAAAFEFVSTRLNLFKEDLSIEDYQAKLVDSNKIFEDSMRESLGTMDQSSERLAANVKRQEERTEAIKADTSAEIERADASLKSKNAMKEQEETAAEVGKAAAEIAKKTADAEADAQKRRTDIARKEAQKRIDDETKNAQKREDIASKNADAIEDIFRKQEEAVAEAGKDLGREEQDIALKGVRERKSIEQNAANERADIERGFRQELQDIQREFSKSAADAERSNDAQAFLQAVRARDEQIDLAKSERDVSIEDVDTGASRQRDELKTQLAQEVEDSKISNTRKLEDLQASLEQQVEAQQIKNERDLEQQAIQEQRQKEQRDLAAQRELEDFERSQQEKQAKLEESLEAQYAVLEAAKVKEIELTRAAEAEKTAIAAEEAQKRAAQREKQDAIIDERERQRERSRQPDDIDEETGRFVGTGIQRGNLEGLAGGGDMAAGQAAIVGEAGPEVFIPATAGSIIPNQTLFSPPSVTQGGAANINNSRSLNIESVGVNPGDAVISRVVQNEMSKVLGLL